MRSTFNQFTAKRKAKYRFCSGAIAEEAVVSLFVLFVFLFFPLLDLTAIGLRSFFLWFACEQAAMAGAKGSAWSTTAYQNSNFTSIQTQAKTTAANVVNMFSGITITSGPTLTVIAQAIPNVNAASLGVINPVAGATFIDKSLYVPILQVSITGSVQPFIVVPFIPVSVPGLNSPFSMTVYSQQQIENPTALSY